MQDYMHFCMVNNFANSVLSPLDVQSKMYILKPNRHFKVLLQVCP